jgi:hypothetical protein
VNNVWFRFAGNVDTCTSTMPQMSALREYSNLDTNYNNIYDDVDDEEEDNDDDKLGDDRHGKFVNGNQNVSQYGYHDGNDNDKNRTFGEEEYSNGTKQQQTSPPTMKDVLVDDVNDDNDDDMLWMNKGNKRFA